MILPGLQYLVSKKRFVHLSRKIEHHEKMEHRLHAVTIIFYFTQQAHTNKQTDRQTGAIYTVTSRKKVFRTARGSEKNTSSTTCVRMQLKQYMKATTEPNLLSPPTITPPPIPPPYSRQQTSWPVDITSQSGLGVALRHTGWGWPTSFLRPHP